MKFHSIGILGGMGPRASIDIYTKIIQLMSVNYNATQDIDFPPMILFSLPLVDFNEAGVINALSVKKQLIGGVRSLEAAGAEFIIIACNSVHVFIDEMRSAVSIPIISIIEEVGEYIEKNNYKKIGLITSESSNKNSIYKPLLKSIGVHTISLDHERQEAINKIILKIMTGKQNNFDKNELVSIIQYLLKKGSEAIILGCTELPILIDEYDRNFNGEIINASRIIASAAIRESMRL
jgi:aspartate racemase